MVKDNLATEVYGVYAQGLVLEYKEYMCSVQIDNIGPNNVWFLIGEDVKDVPMIDKNIIAVDESIYITEIKKISFVAKQGYGSHVRITNNKESNGQKSESVRK